MRESRKVRTVSETKPAVGDLEVKTNKKLKPLLEFLENFGVKVASNSGVKIKEFPIKSYTGVNKTRGSQIIQTRGTRVIKSKVKSAKKDPHKGKTNTNKA